MLKEKDTIKYYTWDQLRREKGVSNPYQLKKLISSGVVERVRRNIYVVDDNYFLENNYRTLQRNRDFLYAYHTAAFLYGFTTRDFVGKFSIVVKQGTNATYIKKAFVDAGLEAPQITYVPSDLYDKIKSEVFWWDGNINVVSIPYVYFQVLKNYDKSVDNWVDLEILNDQNSDIYRDEIIELIDKYSKSLYKKQNYIKGGLRW